MGHKKIIHGIATIEVLFGFSTILCNFISLFLGFNAKSQNIFLFVVGTATLSFSLGLGLLNYRKAACQLLIYFSSVILLSKILIFAGIIQMDWTLETFLPAALKNTVSMCYHAFIVLYFSRPQTQKFFR